MEKPEELKKVLIEPETEETDTIASERLKSRVVLYNDDWHTFDEVIVQLIKAIHCSFEKARSHAFEVHIKGKSIVYEGEMTECLRVSAILEEIALRTEIVT